MKNITYIIMLAFLFAIGCNKDTSNPAAPAVKDNGKDQPTSANSGGTSDACFDIPAPIMTSAVNSTIATVGGTGNITVCWAPATPPDSYYNVARYYPQGNHPLRPQGKVPTVSINPTAGTTLTPPLSNPHAFWGGSQQTIVSSPYSGHYGGLQKKVNAGTWVSVDGFGDTRAECFTDNNGGLGYHVGDVVSYRITEVKSLEGSSPNQCTHHENGPSTPITITVCGPVLQPMHYDACPTAVAGGDGTWAADASCTWTENATTCSNASMTMSFNITERFDTLITCDHSIRTDKIGTLYTGPLCVTATNVNDANDIETETATYNGTNYSVTFINPQALESYKLTYDISGLCDGTGTISTTSTLNTPDCSTTVTGGDCDPNDPANYSNYSIVGADGNYPTSKEGNITWVDANDITVKASGHQWNTHFTLDGENACTGNTTAVPCGANVAIYYCLTDLQGNILKQGGTTCTGNHYNIDGTNQIPNPAVGTAASYLLKFATDQACTNVIWTVKYTAQ